MKDFMKLANGTQKELSIYFAKYKPLTCNPVSFGDVAILGGVRTAKNNGKIYVGTIVQGKRHGKGVVFGLKGKIYEGQMRENQRSGLGVEIYEDGSFYIGGFNKNKREGRGILIGGKSEEKYDYYQGQWVDGRCQGYGYLKNKDCQYIGSFINGNKNYKGI